MSQSDSTVLFRALTADVSFSPQDKRAIRSFARTLGARVSNSRPFTCVISDDAELRRLNNSFLGHDYPTDVLSFPSHASVGQLGELILSAERAAAQAAEFGHNRLAEVCLLMLHGVLHLCGMDHEHDRGEMASAEQKWRQELGLPATLIARAARRRAG